MKISILVLIGLISFSIQNHTRTSHWKEEVQLIDASESKKQKIQLDGIDDHPNKGHMEWFLNHYKEEFIVSDASDTDWKTLEHADLMQKGFSFHTAMSNVSLILIFCKHQDDALIIAGANFPVVDEVQMAGVNGGVLFVAQGDDPDEVTSVLSWFAGEE